MLLALERRLFGDWTGFPLDDAWIHLQFASRLAAGDGLAFNPGVRVAGTTAPLWTALLALLSFLPGPLALWAKLAGVAAHVASIALAGRLARALGLGPWTAALAMLLVGWSDWLVFAATSGMEIPLFVALLVAGLARQVEERKGESRAPCAFLLFGLAALARPEGLLLPLLAALDRAFALERSDAGRTTLRFDRDGARAAWIGLALAATLLVPVALVFAALSGSPLPTTLAAKVVTGDGAGGALAAIAAGGRGLARVATLLFASQPLPLLLAIAGCVELLRRRAGRREIGLLLPLWSFAMPLAALVLARGGELALGNFGRYFFPLLPGIVLLGLVGLSPLAAESSASRSRFARVAAGAVALLLLLWPALRLQRAIGLALLARQNVEESDRRAASFLASRARPDARIGSCDIGLLKYALPNPVLDLGGIVQPELMARIAEGRALGRGWPESLLAWIEEGRPEYVVLYPRWFPLLERQPERFPPLARFRIARNIAMAGEELVVYRTPWTRPRPAEVPTP